jgi:hypothetical protein
MEVRSWIEEEREDKRNTLGKMSHVVSDQVHQNIFGALVAS